MEVEVAEDDVVMKITMSIWIEVARQASMIWDQFFECYYLLCMILVVVWWE